MDEWSSEKIVTNRKMTPEEALTIEAVFMEDSFANVLKSHFMYIYFDEKGYIRFLSIQDSIVDEVSEKYCLSNREAVEFLYIQDDIDQELGEMLYWTGIDNYKKYVPVVHINESNGEREYAEYFLFAKNEIDANEYLYRNGYFDYIFLEDVDA